MKEFKPIPIGVEDFKEIIDKGSYYVDKTAMIQELLDSNAKVNLFTRPRCFGKTLNIFLSRIHAKVLYILKKTWYNHNRFPRNLCEKYSIFTPSRGKIDENKSC